jgi:hypothetical protein
MNIGAAKPDDLLSGGNVVRRGGVFVLLAVTAALLASGFRSSSPPVRPGGKIGKITLLSIPQERTNLEIFTFCRPDILRPGRYTRTCTVPHTRVLFLDCGDFETTKAKLNGIWRKIRWTVSLDGQPVDLRRFGTEDRILYAYPPAGGKNAYLRVWKVAAEDVPTGKHALRCVSRQSGLGTIDATWTFTVH